MDAPELPRLLAALDAQLQLMRPVVSPEELPNMMMRLTVSVLHAECILPLLERLKKQDQFIAAELQSAFCSVDADSFDAIELRASIDVHHSDKSDSSSVRSGGDDDVQESRWRTFVSFCRSGSRPPRSQPTHHRLPPSPTARS